MHISIVTLFPEMFREVFDQSIIGRAQKKGSVIISYVQLRDFATGSYKAVDDHPYGGGAGMILRVDVVDRALKSIRYPVSGIQKPDTAHRTPATRIILLDPQGTTYNQQKAKELSVMDHLILVCGHYEGVDERVRSLVDEEISVGDYVVTGGEIPAMAVVDSVVRLIPGVLKKDDATTLESFGPLGLEYPQYTRPPDYNGQKVPDILTSGNHAEISKWRAVEAKQRTKNRRPDLLDK